MSKKQGNMPSYEEIYREHADRYDELVRHEDHRGNVALLLDRALVPRPRLTVELGCGTSVAADNVAFGTADNASLPELNGAADLVVAGWTIGHLTGLHPDSWREHATRVLCEMRRVRAEQGTIVIFETLGTCVDAPAPPNERLGALYELFEREHSLVREVIATDYAFASPEEAARVMGFFFGPKMAAAVEARRDRVVPEWTGVWIGPVPR